jgi:hypothetical protein
MTETDQINDVTDPYLRPPQDPPEQAQSASKAPARPQTADEIRRAIEHAQGLAEALPGAQRQPVYGLIGQLRKQLKRAEEREAKARLDALVTDAAALVGTGELSRAVASYRAALAQTTEPVTPLMTSLLALAEAAVAALAHAQRPARIAATPGILLPPEVTTPDPLPAPSPLPKAPPPLPKPEPPEQPNIGEVLERRKHYEWCGWDRRCLHEVDLRPGGWADQQEAKRAAAELNAELRYALGPKPRPIL